MRNDRNEPLQFVFELQYTNSQGRVYRKEADKFIKVNEMN